MNKHQTRRFDLSISRNHPILITIHDNSSSSITTTSYNIKPINLNYDDHKHSFNVLTKYITLILNI